MVSIIIPVYNCEKYIEKCINSIINQTYKDFEVIIVDDGSIDNSIEICNKLIKTDKRFKITRQTNKGVSCARNLGLELAKGEYITFIDSDEWVENTFIECLLKGILEEQADMSVCGIVRESLKNVIIGKEKYQIPFGQYALHVISDVPVCACFGRLDVRQNNMAYYSLSGYSF